ncbi:cation:proton antiporter domain-containing protein [Pseudomonas sp. NCHU5208]|uniref:cation:proton antiporter domain-containing protein n=1 Tax=unclassified Pseudomonas TaxID=196821 RepID=UPI003F9B5FCD
MEEFFKSLFFAVTIVLLLGVLSRPLKRHGLAAPLLALLAGTLLGPQVFDLLRTDTWQQPHELLEKAAQLSLAIGLMSVALRLPAGFVPRHWRSLAVLLGLALPLMCLCAALPVYGLFDLSPLLALLIGAVVCPTDPIVATSVVTGEIAERNLDGRLRHLISAESGINDGLGLPLVMLPLLLLNLTPAEAGQHWLLRVLLQEVAGAVLLGLVIGLLAGYLLRLAEAKGAIERPSFMSYTVALSLLTLSAAELLQVDGILAVFFAGLAFDQKVGGKARAEEERVQEAMDQFFTLPIFMLLGAMLPWQDWLALGWPALALVVAVLLLRRLPVLWLLRPWLPALQAPRDLLFAGWFGPIGVAALLYALMASERSGEPLVWQLGSLLICASVVVHGLTATPFTRLYGRL